MLYITINSILFHKNNRLQQLHHLALKAKKEERGVKGKGSEGWNGKEIIEYNGMRDKWIYVWVIEGGREENDTKLTLTSISLSDIKNLGHGSLNIINRDDISKFFKLKLHDNLSCRRKSLLQKSKHKVEEINLLVQIQHASLSGSRDGGKYKASNR